MYLIQSWKDSLSLFKPKNFKLFVMVTAKTIWQTLAFALNYFWWIAVGYLVAEFAFEDLENPVSYGALLKAFILILWTFFLCLIARPSVMRKDFDYFKQYLVYLPGMVAGMMVVMIFFGIIVAPFKFLVNYLPFLYFLHYLVPTAMGATQLFFLFFLLDMPLLLENWSRAIYFAFLMFFYNIFAIVLLLGVLQFLDLAVHLGAAQLGNAAHIAHLFNFLKEPLIVCLVCNFYIKRLHEQQQLYFNQPKE